MTPARVGLLLALLAAACGPQVPEDPEARSVALTAPDSVWVEVQGPTLVAFHPVVSNEQLEADEGLATALDDLAYHLGAAMDSLVAAGFTMHYRGGDTLWLRAGGVRSHVVRDADSATVGYVFADARGRRAVLYGVRGYTDLVAYAHEFRRTGTVAPR